MGKGYRIRLAYQLLNDLRMLRVLAISLTLSLIAAAQSNRDFAPIGTFVAGPGGVPKDAQVALGRMLFSDKRLSRSGQFSCASCHDLAKYGVDGQQFSTGHNQQKGTRNSPTVFNAAGHFTQFWDGRSATIEDQAMGPVMNPVEMAMTSPEEVERVLRGIPGYAKPFQAAFPGETQPVTFRNMAIAIGAFERRLLTPSRWDRYLRGQRNALTEQEQAGLKDFVAAGCKSCHSGPYVGGNSFQRAGLNKGWPNQKDQGRYEVTKNDDDRMMFKVPSLRNVAMTAPYFHDGATKTLPEAVRRMAELQTGKRISDAQVFSIVAWLNALTGDPPKDLIAPPVLPK
jgi:cytochrome c peroxidase